MVKFNLEGLEELEQLGDGRFGSFLGTFGALAIFFGILIGVAAIILWVFSSIGLMNLAKKKKIDKAWLAFLPVGRSYIIGKLGFEVYDKDNKNATNFMLVTLGLGAAACVLGSSNGDLSTLVKYALLFFETWSFYNIFKKISPKNAIVYTVFTALTGTLLGGVFLYVMKNEESEDNKIVDAQISETKEETVKEEKEPKKTNSKKESTKGFCTNCGAKISKEVKFCPECGNKVN